MFIVGVEITVFSERPYAHITAVKYRSSGLPRPKMPF
jgi:hypothetical protein